MNSYIPLLLFSCILCWNTANGQNTIDCYECQNCQIPFNNQTNTATCDIGVNQCMKITAKLGTVYSYVMKQCGPCSNEMFAFGVTYLQVDCCTGRNCNGTTSLTLSGVLLLICMAILSRIK